MTHNAVKSLYGDGPKHSYHRAQEINGGVGKKRGERPQTVYTPHCVLDAIAEVWPEGIELDPCSGLDSLVPANDAVYMSETTGHFWWRGGCDDRWTRARSGLDVMWPERTYCNPPYADLKQWLPKCAESLETIALVPVRPHRKWWRAASMTAEVCYLDPLKFHGYAQTFPAPLCVMYWGSRGNAFREAFGGLGGFYHQ